MPNKIATEQMVQFRTKHNLNREAIARRCEMSEAGFWKIETGRTLKPTCKTVEKLASAFHVSTDQIRGDVPWIVKPVES